MFRRATSPMMALALATALSFAGCAHAAPATDRMQTAVTRLVAAAHRRTTLWPWRPAEPEVAQAAAYGRTIAPLLVARLAADPDRDESVDWNVQQQLALALCRIYGVAPGPGRVYDNRALPETNLRIRPFWRRMLARPR